MQNSNSNAGADEQQSTEAEVTTSGSHNAKPNVSGALHSLHEDLKGFQQMGFLTSDAKMGLGIAIEQVERYIRGDLEARQQ